MVVTPAVRGLFGLEVDALRHLIRLNPQLPAAWETATLRNVAVGAATFDIAFRKDRGKLLIDASSQTPQPLCLTAGAACTATTDRTHRLELNLPAFEVEVPHALPPQGSPTIYAKILTQSKDGFDIEGLGGSASEVDVRFFQEPLQISGATLNNGKLMVHFPAGEGYQRTKIRFTW
jgi:hypothetical protein